MRFTKEKWGRNIPPVSKYPVIFAGRNTHIAKIITDGLFQSEAEANADLIKSAPDMYHALMLCKDWLESTGADGSPLNAVNEALSRADGVTP